MNITVPCHPDKPFYTLVSEVSSGYTTRQDFEVEINCGAEGCYNTWDGDGKASPYNKS